MSWSFESSESCDEKNRHSKSWKRKIGIPIQQMMKDELEEEDTREPVNRLTGFVRDYYLKHLNKLLLQNLESYCASGSDAKLITKEDIERCATELEQRALRSSIVVTLYQRAMSRMTGDIKRNTEQLVLHDKLKHFKPTQIDQSWQTDTVSSDVDMKDPFPTSQTPYEIPTIVSSERKDCTSRPAYELDADHLWPKDYWEPLAEESTIPNFEPEESTEMHQSPLYDIEKDFDDNELLANDDKNEDLILKSDESEPNCSTNFDMLTLDERLALIVGEEATIPPEHKHVNKKKLVWYNERIQHMKVLNSRLKLMSQVKRMKVERRFKILFYTRPKATTNGTPQVDTLDDPLNKQKERIAPWIIKYLNPYYTNGRIANKELFKSTAKYVSDSLLDKNVLQNEIDVQDFVESLMLKM